MKDRTTSEEAHQAELQTFIQRRIGRYIRKLRVAKGLKQETVAEEAAIHIRTYGALERGETDFQLSTLMKVLGIVGGTLTEAFRGRVPAKFQGNELALHEKLKELLDAKEPWPTAARVNVNAVYLLYEQEQEKEKKP